MSGQRDGSGSPAGAVSARSLRPRYRTLLAIGFVLMTGALWLGLPTRLGLVCTTAVTAVLLVTKFMIAVDASAGRTIWSRPGDDERGGESNADHRSAAWTGSRRGSGSRG
ncbi:hypothetical protein ETD83_09035 [Actinomadura soli]|uniref:Uncharacterized protein n=1 Tax=Actinomadura soli TaxID=2508997 RepID=A0A5C4JGV7_9ACTN|nr:hypothetical protein [Actinomadura soli]TMR04216.1 hypothetical protein ETD83_09035 [Actinomadura soli]